MTAAGGRTRLRRSARPARRRPLVAAVALAAVVLALAGVVGLQLRPPDRPPGACGPPVTATEDGAAGTSSTSPRTWVASWASALRPALPDHPSSEGFTDRTVRQVAHLSLGGERLRLSLSNAAGDRPLLVGATTVARCHPDGGPVTGGDPVTVTFGGRPSVTVPVGASATSDPVALPVRDGGAVLVSTWFPRSTGPTTWHASAWTSTYVAEGDATRSTGQGYARHGSSVFFLAEVDVLTHSGGAVVTFGDSITEGSGGPAMVDAHAAYPDVLARRLARAGPERRMAVVNAGVSGNRLLTDGPGRAMVTRFGRDVLDRTDVRTVVVLGGVNDIIRSDGRVSPDALVAGHEQLVTEARAAGVRVVGATILPFGASRLHTDAGEATRQRVNDWIRTSGTFDAVADLDAVTRDPDDPTRLRLDLDSGDGLHPSPAGYTAMADAIRLADLSP